MFISFLRITRFAARNFWRDIWLSSITIFIFVLAITLVGVLSGVRVVTTQAINVLKSKADVVVTFKVGTPEKLVAELKAKLESLPETGSVTFVTAAENLRRFKELHVDDSTVIQGADAVGQNPFGPSLKIQARRLDEYPKISKVLEDEAYAEAIESGGKSSESNQLAIQKLSNFTRNVDRFSAVLTIIFSVIAVLVVLNTMRIAMYTHREEIGIMKLVGASNAFVRGPFLAESVFIGALAAILASVLLLAGISLLASWFNSLFQGYDVNMAEYFRANFFAIFWLPLVGAIVLSVASAGIAVGRYLRV
ncbi:MAG: FtsX-like permease family protein [Candidatus Kerfeldbacteria bacterium]|nr:FtsX-like permease family protein [Candidatus Kerfeldbacteria bacterium]